MAEDIEVAVAQLEAHAGRLRDLLKYAPRPFVIEFAGTPKAGKSTSVEAVRHFLSRHGFRVHVLAERAAVCPIPMKGHLFFNTWCVSSMLAELLANIETDADIIIVDRGLFDGLVWLGLQEARGELTGDEARSIESFILMDRWRTLTDLVVLMSVSAEDALTRETTQRITRKGGSIMNPEVLSGITNAVDTAEQKYRSSFRSILRHGTSGESVRQSSIRLADGLLSCLERFLNPEVLVVSRQQLQTLESAKEGNFGEDAFAAARECIERFGRFMHRAEAEERSDVVQIVAAGLLMREDKVFLFQRKEADPKYRLYGKTTVWQGTHVAKNHGGSISGLLRKSLQERLSRTLFLSRVFETMELGYCWDADDPKSSRHLGIMYKVQIDNPHTATDLRKKEFRRKRGHSLVGEFVTWADLADQQDDLNLESWSKAVLNYMRGTAQ